LTEQIKLPGAELDAPEYKRNFWAFVGDLGFFQIGMTFASSSTVIPSLFSRLTTSEVTIGVATGIISVAWMLPQLIAAGLTAGIKHKKAFVVRLAWIFRPIMLLIALAVGLFGKTAPTLTLVLVTLGIFVFFIFDAIVSMPWFDLMHACLPTRRRGRMQGAGMVFGALGGIGGGFLVRYVLSPECRWDFPINYALLFVLAFVAIVFSILCVTQIHEPAAAYRTRKVVPIGQLLRSLPGVLKDDPRFVRIIILRLIAGFVTLAGAFYVLYALRELGFRQEDTGLFISAQVMGSLVAGLIQGVVQDRWGPVFSIRINILFSMAPPILALMAGPIVGASPEAVRYIYMALYAFLGLYAGSMGWPFLNWVLEYAPQERRTLYIGALNTFGATMMFAPAIGGIIARTVSYPAVFITALVIAIVALIFSRGIYSPRAEHNQDSTAA